MASGPSGKAIDAGARVLYEIHHGRPLSEIFRPGEFMHKSRSVLAAASDPALGLDRSVCLRDVLGRARRDRDPMVARLIEGFLVRHYGDTDGG